MGARFVLFWLALGSAPGCFDPSYGGGQACSELDNCPPGFFCDQTGVCLEDGSPLLAPLIVSAPPPTTGWLDSDGAPIGFELAAPGRGILECRSGPESVLDMLDFGLCDDGDGTTPVHLPGPDPVAEEGTYRTEIRVRLGDRVSEVTSHRYYVHRSLDRVPVCGPPATDEQAFAIAKTVLQEGAPFGSGVDTFNPSIRIPFDDVIVHPGMAASGVWDPGLTAYQLEVESLRRRFVVNPQGTLLLVRRGFESRIARYYNDESSCKNGFQFGRSLDNESLDCTFMVLNSRGQSVCVVADQEGQLVAGVASEIGWVKLASKRGFSPKGPLSCSTCGIFYLELPP